MPKVPVPVNRSKFQQSVEHVEKDGPIKEGKTVLYKLIADHYNETFSSEKPITPSVAALRINEFDIKIKTTSAKKKRGLVVNQSKLQQSVEHVEKDGPVEEGKVALYRLVADHYNESLKEEEQIGFNVVGAKIIEFGIQIKTKNKAGRKGFPKGIVRRRIDKRTRADKFKENPKIQQHLNELRQTTLERCQPLVQRIAEGSMAAAVKLHCLDCCGYVTAEIRNCTGTNCPLWAFRPYQGAVEEDEQTQEQGQDAA